MEIEKRTRAQTLAMETASAAAKKRKIISEKLQFVTPFLHSDKCSSPGSDHVEESQCSSNISSELMKECLRSVVDLEGEVDFENSKYFFNCRERRETTPTSDLRTKSNNLESKTAKPKEANNRHKSKVKKMAPSKMEIEEFFSQAEKADQKRFAERYNYDVVKDVPLDGRYEWVKLNP